MAIVLCIVLLLFARLASAQISIEPESPKWGTTMIVSVDPDATQDRTARPSQSDAVFAVLHTYHQGLPHRTWAPMDWDGRQFVARLIIPRGCEVGSVVILADGTLVDASPLHNADIFYGVIGGYGGLGVITEATLELTDNVRVKRHERTMPIDEYTRHFIDNVRPSSAAIFHSGIVYPDAYDTVRAVTYSKTDDALTTPDHLVPENTSYRLDRLLYWMVSEWPFGKAVRRHVVDPIYFHGEPVSWRNYEASYDTAELEPASRTTSTYVLEEYFVPVNRFDDFVPIMREVFRRHHVNVINVSIRHAREDPGSLLAWARTEVFAFVVYYKQGTRAAAREEVGVWTRELIDAALSVGGSYYLPYQLHASHEQFLRAYPRAHEFFTLKQRLDPTNKMRNELWNKYYHPQHGASQAAAMPPKR